MKRKKKLDEEGTVSTLILKTRTLNVREAKQLAYVTQVLSGTGI